MTLSHRAVGGSTSLRNWATLCALLLMGFLLYHDPLLLLSKPPKPPKPGGLALDMAADSIDDMYEGCRSEAASVIDLYGVFEWHFNRNFSFAWASAERHAKKPVHKQLKEEHAIVLYIYTQFNHIRQQFDKAVRTGKKRYSTYGFRFHYFYFYLTEAIQILLYNQTSCRVTYHRTWKQFNPNVINANIRFGSFALAASAKQSFDLNASVSCFEVYTCFGADITYYSATKEVGQVLIPPYEVFRVADVLTNDPRCSVVYRLQSTRIPRRDLNCKLSPRQIQTYFGAVSTHWSASSFGRMSACFVLLILISVVLIKQRQKCFVAAVLSSLLVLMIIVVMMEIS